MLYPDPKQRTVLGWQIRWVAGLFALLMVAAGAIPAYAAETVDPPLEALDAAIHETADDEQATAGEIRVATGDMLGAKSGSETEVEIEEDDLDASCLPSPIRLFARLTPSRRDRFADDASTGRPGSGRSAPRAPPLD